MGNGNNPIVEGIWQLLDDLSFIGCMLYARWSAFRAGGSAPFVVSGDNALLSFFSGAMEFWATFAILALLKGFTISRAFVYNGLPLRAGPPLQVWSWVHDVALRWVDDGLLIGIVLCSIHLARWLGTTAPLTYSWDNFGFFANHERYWELLLLAGTIKSSISRTFRG